MTMSKLRLFDPDFNESFESMFRRMMRPLRLEKELLDDLDVRVDVVEKNGVYKVRADLPGVKKENINVRIDGNIVRIDAETQDAKEFKEDGGKVLRSERYYGSVSRSFSLADDVDESKAVAKYSDGVLSLELPRKASSGSGAKRLTIQ
jgi:HSP20 family protein